MQFLETQTRITINTLVIRDKGIEFVNILESRYSCSLISNIIPT